MKMQMIPVVCKNEKCEKYAAIVSLGNAIRGVACPYCGETLMLDGTVQTMEWASPSSPAGSPSKYVFLHLEEVFRHSGWNAAAEAAKLVRQHGWPTCPKCRKPMKLGIGGTSFVCCDFCDGTDDNAVAQAFMALPFHDRVIVAAKCGIWVPAITIKDDALPQVLEWLKSNKSARLLQAIQEVTNAKSG